MNIREKRLQYIEESIRQRTAEYEAIENAILVELDPGRLVRLKIKADKLFEDLKKMEEIYFQLAEELRDAHKLHLDIDISRTIINDSENMPDNLPDDLIFDYHSIDEDKLTRNEIDKNVSDNTIEVIDNNSSILSNIRSVLIDNSKYEISAYLITNGVFELFLMDPLNSYWLPKGKCREDGKVDNLYLSHCRYVSSPVLRSNFPVNHVSYYAAVACLDWLGRQYKRYFRLPTIEEWRIAAQAGDSGANWWYSKAQAGQVNCKQTRGYLTEVDIMEPNEYGICDALGNVYELCLTSKRQDTPIDKINVCGGAFNTMLSDLLLPMMVSLNECRPDVGFRYVCEPLH